MNKSFLQSFGWGEFQKSLGKTITRANGLQSIEQDIPLLNSSYAYIPYAPISHGLVSKLAENKDLIFIRVESTVNFDTVGFIKTQNIQPSKTLVLDLSKSEEELLAGMHNKTRYNIGVAKRHEVEVGAASAQEEDEVLKLICDTAERQGYKSHDFSYYKSMVEFFHTNKGEDYPSVSLMTAKYQNQILAGGLYIDYEKTRTYLFGGTSTDFKNVMAPHLLHWQAINDAKNAGLSNYDFWGIETAKGDTPGFVRFKLGFGGQQIEYPGAYDFVLKPFWYNTYTILRKINSFIR